MIKVLIKTDTRYPVNRKIVRVAVEDTFKKYKIENADFEVSVAVVGARKMKQLTDKYLNDGGKHQILTFALEEEAKSLRILNTSSEEIRGGLRSHGFINPSGEILRLGDIVLCWPQTILEASEDEMMVDDKVYELICHGTEHLLGKDHDESLVG